MITNHEFLTTIFGDDHVWAHVTSFPDDPGNIAPDRRMNCWSGGYYSQTYVQPGTNQYYTISTFYGDPDSGKARRRKALFRATHVIVADDVKEKLPEANAARLPPPSFKLETSPGSEQWGWILSTPATDRHQVENLLDGLVAQGLAPDGKDPGMKGVTRYVRLPEGYNTKATKLVDGRPRQCQMLEWHPDRKVSLEELAVPFDVDIHAARREQSIDGAANIPDHPLLHVSDIVHIKEVRSDGRFDVSCPWVSDHTGQSDDGSAIFTNKDGSIGFKCHHGSCQHRTGRDLIKYIESHQGCEQFSQRLNVWRVSRTFANISTPPGVPDFLAASPLVPTTTPGVANDDAPGGTTLSMTPQPDQMISYQTLIDKLCRTPRNSPEALEMAKAILQAVDQTAHVDRIGWWEQVRDHMTWTRQDFGKIVDDLRVEWYPKNDVSEDVYRECVYVAELNQFFNLSKRMFLSTEAYRNTYGHIDDQILSEALIGGRVTKVDRLDYAPAMPAVFTENGVQYGNSWREHHETSVPGDVQRWLNHFDVLGWGSNRKHMLQWMAHTLRHPERKINHCLLLGGGEGNGKDFLLYPLAQAMGADHTTINGDELLRDFDDFLLSCKYLHVNEAELGNRKEAEMITNKLKPLTSAPPTTLRVNPKGIRPIHVRNVVNVSMTTNSATPLKMSQDARRYYAVWTDVSIRNSTGEMTQDWREYWADRWSWMRDCEGWRACLHYLVTQVDLSDFDAGGVPVVTDFVREIQEASEDPMVTIMKDLISQGLGNFKADLVTSRDIIGTLRMVPMLMPDHAMDQRVPSAGSVSRLMKQNGLAIARRARNSDMDTSVWILRDQFRYRGMSPLQLAVSYAEQMATLRAATPLARVDTN